MIILCRHAFTLFALASSLAGAQTPQREAFATDSTARMYKLAEGVFAITHAAATQDWPHGNTGVVIGTNGVLIIDSNYLPDRVAQNGDVIYLLSTANRRVYRRSISTGQYLDQ